MTLRGQDAIDAKNRKHAAFKSRIKTIGIIVGLLILAALIAEHLV